MKIYTKTGDKGETSLFGGKRVPKDSLRIEAYGTVDELNSILGIVRSKNPNDEIENILSSLQDDLFVLGADLATPLTHQSKFIPRISKVHVQRLEKTIDRLEKKLPPLKIFILPGGSVAGSHLHFARTVCRRAERNTVRLSRNENIGEMVMAYLNRLSDLLFVMARYANHLKGKSEEKWVSGKRSVTEK